MNRTIFVIEMRSLRQCIEHLRLINMEELATNARTVGTEADREFIAAVAAALPTLPPTH